MRQLSEADASFIYLETLKTRCTSAAFFTRRLSSGSTAFNTRTVGCDATAFAPRSDHETAESYNYHSNSITLIGPMIRTSSDSHIRDITLPSPGRFTTLMRFVSDSLSNPLDKGKPLWEVTLFRGLGDIDRCPEATCAVLFKIHQTLIDSTTGSELIGSLLDTTPTPPKFRGIIPPWSPQPLPSVAQMIGHAYGNALTMPKRWAVLARDAASSTFYQALMHQFRQLVLPVAFQCPGCSFNRPISVRRTYDAFCCNFDKIRHLKPKAPGVSTNAVLMTLCSRLYCATSNRKIRVCVAP